MTTEQASAVFGRTVQSAQRYGNGTYYTLSGYTVYVPDEIDNTTSAFIYYPGAGGAWPNDAKVLGEYIKGGNANQIIFISNISRDSNLMNGQHFQSVINNIGNQYGVDIENVDTMGFSAGGPAVYSTIVTLAKSSEEPMQHSAILNDVVGFSISQDDINALVRDESRIMIIEPSGVPSFAQTLANGGVDVVLVSCSGGHGSHVNINRDILQNDIVNLLSGDREDLVDSSFYHFSKWDANSKKWVQMSVEEVYEHFNNYEADDGPFKYYKKLSKLGDLESNNSYIKQTVNEMRGLIRNSDFLSNTSFEESYSSTTKIPNAESEVVQSFFSECATLLNLLAKDTVAIVKIGDGIADLNDTSKQEAQNINDSMNYYSNNTGTPTYSSSPSYSSSPTYSSTPTGIPSNTNPDTTQSTNVNVDLKPADLTEEQYKALFESDGSMHGNAKACWNFFKAKGLSDEAAAGVMGNIQAECNFRLTALGDSGTSFGLIQWHKGRWTNLKNFCQQKNLDENSLQGQLEFLWYESLDPNSSYGKSMASKGFYNTKDPVEAAVIFHDVVERSASSPEGVRSKRGGYATSWYNELKDSYKAPEKASTESSSSTTDSASTDSTSTDSTSTKEES